MKGKLILLNILKILFSLVFVVLYLVIVNKLYNTNIWLYKSFVLFMLLVLLIYFIFKLLNMIIRIKKEIIAKIIDIKYEGNFVNITYQYLDSVYNYTVRFEEYDQNKYFKYQLYNWYAITVEGNKVVEILDPAMEPVISKKEIEKNSNSKLKYGIPMYLYFIYEFLFLINVILFPIEVVITEYSIGFLFILIEVINILLFFLNSKILKDNKK